MNKALITLMTKVFGDFNKQLEAQFDAEKPGEKVYAKDEVKISDEAVGGKFELRNGDGTLSEAPDGEYEMEDGTVYEVKGGFITAISDDKTEDTAKGEFSEEKAEEPAEEAKAEEVVEEPKVEEVKVDENAELKAQIEALQAETAELKTQLGEFKAMFGAVASKEEVTNLTEQFTQFNQTVIKLAALPVEKTKTSTNNIAKDKSEDNQMEFASLISTLTKKK